MSAAGKPAHSCTRILTDSARKIKINIGHQHDCWMELKEGLRFQTHAEV